MNIPRFAMAVLLVPVMLGLPALGADTQPATGGTTVPAAWKQTKIEFHYFGRTSRYSCDGLRDKVRALLLDMGVRGDMRLRTNGCEIGRISLVGINPGLTIEFSAPAPQAGTEVNAFDARYVPFNFRQDAFRNLNIGDCELVEEFVRQVIPKLTVRNLQRDITCVPYQQSSGSYRVSGEVLKPVTLPAQGSPASMRN
jgi:hypothetical protein